MSTLDETGETNQKVQSEEQKQEYRKYLEDTTVAEFYRENHQKQTYENVKKMHAEIFPLGKWKLDIFQVIELLDDIIDKSDPDLSKKQIVHAVQTGESCRTMFPDKDWFHLMGFMHDLGKILNHPKFYNLPQWTVVGDTFPLGCAFSDKCVYPKYFEENPDYKHEVYSTKLGIYSEKIGFDNVLMSFGHDEYLYQVLKNNECTLPEEALYVIRYHSFYPWHQENAYDYLANEKDLEFLTWVRAFQKCDLYSKCEKEFDHESKIPYYKELIKKYFPNNILNW